MAFKRRPCRNQPLRSESRSLSSLSIAKQLGLGATASCMAGTPRLWPKPCTQTPRGHDSLFLKGGRLRRRAVQLSFTGCTRFFDSDLATLVEHLPVSLEVLRLDLGFTGLTSLDSLQGLSDCQSLVHLELRFPGAKPLGGELSELLVSQVHAISMCPGSGGPHVGNSIGDEVSYQKFFLVNRPSKWTY